MSDIKVAVSELIKKRAACKRRITSLFTKKASDASAVDTNVMKDMINNFLAEINDFDIKVNALLSELEESEYNDEIEKQTLYLAEIKTKLSALVPAAEPNSSIASLNFDLKLPDLKCDYFSGETSSSLEYHTFISQFNNCIGFRSNLSNSIKLSYLKSYLKGYAFKIVQHLQINDQNYEIAIKLLSNEFLDKDHVIECLLNKLQNLSVKPDSSYLNTKIFLNDCRCILSDLLMYELDFFSAGAGNTLVSNIIFHKLPILFRQELVRKLSKSSPKVEEIFDNYLAVIDTLKLKGNKEFSPQLECSNDKNSSSVHNNYAAEPSGETGKHSQLSKHCKFCICSGHNMLHCKKYNDYKARIERCKKLKMCFKCSSQNHMSSKCNNQLDFACLFCHSKSHISALCPAYKSKVTTNYCINQSTDSGYTYLLPIVNVAIGNGKNVTNVKCLLDTGSQRSYMAANVLERLCTKSNDENNKIQINTFINSEVKSFSEVSLSVDFAEGRKFAIPFLANNEFNLNFCISGLKQATDNIASKFKLACDFNSDHVKVEGLLGVDCLQFLQQNNVVDCLGGKAFQLKSGLVPFGNIDNFLNDSQLLSKYSNSNSISHLNSPDCGDFDETSIVNFVLNPDKSYFDPMGCLEDSSVETNLDKLYKVESLGISDSSDYDTEQISKFDESIELINGKYHVQLPWKESIKDVRSNFEVSKLILNKVVNKLNETELYDSYNNVIQQQVEDGIIEPISLDSINVYDHVWVPHRPVVKHDEQSTTKVRIVLNCSLKIKDTPSLNEAAYAGIDMMNNLLELLLKLRFHKYFVISDIRQAFLNIMLKDEEDRNKFSILWINKEGKLTAFRYRTIVFGFVNSPFILHHVIHYHLKQYENDIVNKILQDNMYVDNLFFTSNNLPILEKMYEVCYRRMIAGGFELRSWNSNSSELQQQFEADGRGVAHLSDCEKVLGYLYNTEKDKLKLAEYKPKDGTLTKRNILSCLASIFDPLGLTMPVLVKGKLLLQRLWQSKVDWDEPLNKDISNEWNKINEDFSKLPSIEFPRQAVDDECSLYLFCDASKSMYGFTCYCKTKDSVDLVFAKAKNAPTKPKTLPTLELLSVYLAFKCLPILLKSFMNANIKDLFICIDAQVVISWIMTKNVKSKNTFALNRVKDIALYRDQIETEFNLNCNFKYIPTEFNPADLLTRGLTFREFHKNLNNWLHGPQFLSFDKVKWPVGNTGCMSSQTKLLTCTSNVAPPSILPVNNYSNFNKLIRVTALVLGFISKLKREVKSREQMMQDSKLYWIKFEQNVYYSDELNFLKNPNGNVPINVRNLNLFLDENSIIRCRGRLEKSDLSYDVKNPILIPRNSPLSDLLIKEAHLGCKHLGVASTLSAIRMSGLWIPKGRAKVKSFLNRCIVCKKLNSFAFKYPKVTDYIKDRVQFDKPFQHTGVDFTGHVFIKFNDILTKMYIVVFTCYNTRAVHLDLVQSLSCKDFLLSFIRFCNRFCIPDAIYSDNANTFIQAMGIVSESNIDNDFEAYLTKNSIKHYRIPLYSAWVGAYWERLIRTIKSCIVKSTGRKHFNYFEYVTLLADVENCINSRPLTYLNEDNLQCITPNCFLKPITGRSLMLKVDKDEFEAAGHRELINSLEQRESMLTKFKEEWHENYLLSLRETSRNVHQIEWDNKISVNDIVLISSPVKPRALWKMGRVLQLLPGDDGKIRCVKVMRPDHSEAIYSISHLYPLEIAATGTKTKPCDESSSPGKTLPRRRAAVKCLELMKKCN